MKLCKSSFVIYCELLLPSSLMCYEVLTLVGWAIKEHALGVFNPLTTNDAIWRRLNLAACYQLAQSISKIGFAWWAGFSMGCCAHGSSLGWL